MNAQELAARLNGREYRREITREEEAMAKAAGLVVVFGASDDLVEFRGAINDEADAYNGTTAYVDAKGLLPDRNQVDDDDEALRDYFARQPNTLPIKAVWDEYGSYSWTFETSIPHETFEVVEDGELYCRGIVFALADVGKGVPA